MSTVRYLKTCSSISSRGSASSVDATSLLVMDFLIGHGLLGLVCCEQPLCLLQLWRAKRIVIESLPRGGHDDDGKGSGENQAWGLLGLYYVQ